jgi:pyruvate/2-oxoacid:ferredoxin oxidoreductase beta subunit
LPIKTKKTYKQNLLKIKIMKKIILGLSLVIAFASCTKSPENQAQENVQEYITTKMDDPKSYESVSFGKLEKGKSSYQDEEKYKNLVLEYNDMDKRVSDAYDLALSMTHENTIKSATESYEKLASMRSSVLTETEQYLKKYKSVDIFKMKHSFRGKNKMGAIILDSCNVILDKNLKVKLVKQL